MCNIPELQIFKQYIYIYIYIHIYTYIHTYIYIYILWIQERLSENISIYTNIPDM